MLWMQGDCAQKRRELVSFCWWNLSGLEPPGTVSDGPHYRQYLRRIRYRLCDMGGGVPPSIIGVCEVSMDGLLDLYGELGGESAWHVRNIRQGTRRIGVIFSKREWTILDQVEIEVPRGSQRTRPLFHVTVGHRMVRDLPLHIILNHWVKRGEAMSEEIRRREGATLADLVQQIVEVDRNAPVLILGDFNADPTDPALIYWANSVSQRCQLQETRPYGGGVPLYNCATRLQGELAAYDTASCVPGTYYHEVTKQWHTYDQVFVTSGMLTGSPFRLDESSLRVYAGPTLLEGGKPAPFRSDAGIGYSDHLPICGRLWVRTAREGGA